MKINKEEKKTKIKNVLLYLREYGYIYSKNMLEKKFKLRWDNYKNEFEKVLKIKVKYNDKGRARHKLELKKKYKWDGFYNLIKNYE